VSAHIFRSVALLVFVGGLIAFFLINPGRWLSPRSAEPLVIRLSATPDLEAWLQAASARFLEKNPIIGGRPLSLIIAYEEDAIASAAVADRLRAATSSSAPLPADTAWLTSRTALQLLETTHRMPISDKTVIPLASTLLTIAIWETGARTILPSTGVLPAGSTAPSWSDIDVSWTVWQRLSVGRSHGSPSAPTSLRWALPHPLRSAAGLAGLALMGLGDVGPQGGRWPDGQGEQVLSSWLRDILRSVHRFRPSARATANDFITYGPSQADLALLPEHLALDVLALGAERAGPGVVLLYPRVNLAYEYVFVDMSHATAHPQQHESITAFQRFLRADEGQRLALAHGLRPVSPHLLPHATDPWSHFSAKGSQFALAVRRVDVQAIIGPANRLAREVMAELDAR
jgi:hypothetical protein